MKGGVGAASHGVSVYGGIGDQHRVGPNDNMIAIKGGKRSRRGGSTGIDLGASLALLGLNELVKRRRTSIKKGGKSKKAGKKGGKRRRSMKKGGGDSPVTDAPIYDQDNGAAQNQPEEELYENQPEEELYENQPEE